MKPCIEVRRLRRRALLSSAVCMVMLAQPTDTAAAIPSSRSAPTALMGEAAASAAAREYNTPVRVSDLTTETEDVLANPDGTFTWTQSVRPVRVRRGDTWRPLDLTLVRRADGVIGPEAASVDLRLSGGGRQSPLVVVGKDGYEVGLGWDGELPAPELDGPTATYREVLPDVDLVVTAVVEGFNQVLVVKTPQAARNPKLRKITFGSHTKNTTVGLAKGRGSGVTTSGPADGLEVRDASGRMVFVGDASRMWDSSGDGTFADRVSGSVGGARVSAMGVEVTRDTLAVIPDESFLIDSATRFPAFIDPSYNWSGGKNHHVVVQSGIHAENRNYDRTAFPLNDLKAGIINDGGWNTSRSFIEMNTVFLKGRFIHSATLRTRVVNSFSCAGGPTELWATYNFNSDTRWNAQPGWVHYLSSNSRSNNADHCPSDGGADFNATSQVDYGAKNGWNFVTLGLRAQSEGDQNSWRRFDLNPVLEAKYNSYPNKPDQLATRSGTLDLPCVRGDGRPYVPNTQPALRARLTDPDPGAILNAGFYWKGLNNSASGRLGVSGIGTGGFGQVQFAAGALANDGVYEWDAQSGDDQLLSAFSDKCEFGVDTVRPGPPAVTSTDYPPAQLAGGPGRTGIFTVQSNGTTDVKSFLYTFTQDEVSEPSTRIQANEVGGTATIPWTPILDGRQFLYVRSVDRAGNQSDLYRYEIRVQRHDPLVEGVQGHWRLNTDLADSSGNGRALLAWTGTTVTAEGYEGSAAGLDGVDDRLYRTQSMVDTSRSYSVSAWVRLDRKNGGFTVASQDGNSSSAFFLQYHDGLDRWSMRTSNRDVDNAPGVNATSRNSPQVGVWTHLTGVYDSGARTLRLYVNGVLEGEAAYTATWSATGTFLVGAAKWNRDRVQYFPGAIDEVRVYDRVLMHSEAALLANQGVLRAHYSLNEGQGTTTRDEVTGRFAALQGSVSWSVGEFTSAHFTGVGGTAMGEVIAARPAIRTDLSYTVAAWVRLDGLDAYTRTAVSVVDAQYSPFMLEYRPSQRKWDLLISCSPTQACYWNAFSAGEASAGEWVHLTGVYDAVAKKAKIYVNGQLSGEASNVTGWNGSGDLVIGRTVWSGQRAEPWRGDVDDVRLYSGALSSQEIAQLVVR